MRLIPLLGLLFLVLITTSKPLHAFGKEEKCKEEKVSKNESHTKQEEPNSSFSYDEVRGLLIIRFFEAEMEKDQPDVIEQLKCTNQYVFDAEFALPEELWKAIGSNCPLVIKKGVYPVSYQNGIYSVSIQF